MQDATTEVSIVTISLNQAAFLPEALNSVLEQPGVRLEMIVVDPGSSDDSRAIIRQIPDPRLRALLVSDGGPAEGLNNGWEVARGEIIGYVNADDQLLPGALGRVRDIFAQAPDVDIVYGDGYISYQDDTERYYAAPSRISARGVALGTDILFQPSTFFRRTALPARPFNEDNRVSWDTELILACLARGLRWKYLPEPLSIFRWHALGLTGGGLQSAAVAAQQRAMAEGLLGRAWRRTDQWEVALRRTARRAEAARKRPQDLVRRLSGAWRSKC